MSLLQEPPEPKTERPPPPRRHAPTRAIAIWGPLLLVLALALLVVFGLWRRAQERHEQEAFASEVAQLTVNVVTARRDTQAKTLVLPGNVVAFQEATLYARANGYVAKWLVDIGDNVTAGQLLAEIETPEIDQQLAQARANFEIARVTAQRWRELVEKRVVAPQDFDEKEAAYEAAQASVRQLEQTQAFKNVLAPFAGKITSRSVDIGTLVSAGGNGGTPLFSIAQTDPLRVYIYVPQTNAPSVREGLSAKVSVQEYSERAFDGKVTRTAGALDPASRAMQVEVQVPNHDGMLFAGMYAQVKFVLNDDNAPFVVPANVVSFRTAGPQIALVTAEKKIHWQVVQIGRDYGTQLEVLNGLPEKAQLVVNPTDDLQDGMAVEVQAPPPSPAAAQGSPAASPH